MSRGLTPQVANPIPISAGPATGEYRYAGNEAAALDAFAWMLESAPAAPTPVGIDIETTSLAPSQGRIGLVQVACGARAVVLDAIAFEPWSVLQTAFEGRDPQWIAHNAEFEQSWLARHAGFTLLPMFDTRWVYVRERAHRTGEFLPTDSSLAVVSERVLGLPLSKEQRLSDWSARPLTQPQLDYAALDAMVLIPLRETFERRAAEEGWSGQIEAAARRAASEAMRLAPPLAAGGASYSLPLTGTD